MPYEVKQEIEKKKKKVFTLQETRRMKTELCKFKMDEGYVSTQ